MIPITVVQFGEAEERQVIEVLRSGNIAQGPKVAQLESAFAEFVGVRHAIAVNNGTTSLVAALTVLDLQPGDEVLTSPFTFVATLNAILEAGATARFADISDADFNLTADSVAEAMTERTKVVMPVHLYGQIADMAGIEKIATSAGAAIVEDAAQAHGSRQGGRSAGSFGIGSFSFYATKNITTGEGGMITTNDDGLADRLRVLRNQGMRARYQYEVAGHNYRMTDLQASIGIPQLERYETIVAARRANADYLNAAMGEVRGIVVPRQLDGRDHVWHQYTIRVTPDARVSRDEFVTRLTELGVGNGIYYPRLVFDYPPYHSHPGVIAGRFPVAERVVDEVVSLPVHPALGRADLDHIAASVAAAAGDD